jgi:hypothetical protein
MADFLLKVPVQWAFELGCFFYRRVIVSFFMPYGTYPSVLER